MSQPGRRTLGLTVGGGLGLIAGLIGRGGGSFMVPLAYMTGLEARVAAGEGAKAAMEAEHFLSTESAQVVRMEDGRSRRKPCVPTRI